jgi:orotate phosphoribosyltransferase-like protein
MSAMKRLAEDIEVLILKGLSTEEIAKSLNMPNDLAEAMVYDVEQMMLGTLDTELTYEDLA